MKYVEILSFTGKEPKKLGEVQLVDNEVVFEGFSQKMLEILKQGVYAPGASDMQRYTPKDKLKFLEALKFEFSGSAVRATDVKERKV